VVICSQTFQSKSHKLHVHGPDHFFFTTAASGRTHLSAPLLVNPTHQASSTFLRPTLTSQLLSCLVLAMEFVEACCQCCVHLGNEHVPHFHPQAVALSKHSLLLLLVASACVGLVSVCVCVCAYCVCACVCVCVCVCARTRLYVCMRVSLRLFV
jgi:hypothetical protein